MMPLRFQRGLFSTTDCTKLPREIPGLVPSVSDSTQPMPDTCLDHLQEIYLLANSCVVGHPSLAAIRSTRKPIIPDEAKFNGICVDFTRMEVIREGEPIALTAEEFKILKFFLHNQDRDVSRDELLNEVRDHHDFSCLRTVDNHILKLRQKLERSPENPAHFLTTYGVGYRFVR